MRTLSPGQRNVQRTLPPHLMRAVDRIITEHRRIKRAPNEWWWYTRAKSQIDRLCGWGALDGGGSSELFDLAIQRYFKGVGL